MTTTPRKKRRKGDEPATGIQLVEEAVQLVRSAPLGLLVTYYVGTAPFVLGLAYFWADMAHSAFAEVYCAPAALGVAVLFLWMKTWQAAYVQGLRAFNRDDQPPARSWAAFARMATAQAVVQPWGILAVPASALMAVPFPWTYAFFQNFTVLGDDSPGPLREKVRRAWSEAQRWTGQNVVALWLCCPLLPLMVVGLWLIAAPVAYELMPEWLVGLLMMYAFLFTAATIPAALAAWFAAVNVAAFIGYLPQLLRIFFGIEPVLTYNETYMLNSTFVVIVGGITYLLMDPVVKAVYVLRCFYGFSLRTGEDIQVALRRVSRGKTAAMLLLALSLAGIPGTAAAAATEDAAGEAVVQEDELDQAIDEVLRRREFAWRLPRAQRIIEEDSAINRFFESISESLENAARAVWRFFRKMGDWLEGLFPEPDFEAPGSFSGWQQVPRVVMIVLLVCFGLVLVYWLVRIWLNRPRDARLEADVVEHVTPDLEDEATTADALPEEGWLATARDLMDKGEYRLALRALFLATLAHLDGRGFIRVAKFKSNRDYARELGRRAHDAPELMQAFGENVRLFESAWYGAHRADAKRIERFRRNQQRIHTDA